MKNNFITDLSFIGFVVLCFIMTGSAFVFQNSNQLEAIIFLDIIFFIVLITYFTSLTLGLIINLVLIFGCGSYALFQIIHVGDFQNYELFFWMTISPIITFVAYFMTEASLKLQSENTKLRSMKSRLSMLDEETNLRTFIGFKQDYLIYSETAGRYAIPLSVMIITVRHQEALGGLLSGQQLGSIIKAVTNSLFKSIRKNDVLYIIDKNKLIWGLLLFIGEEQAPIVINRLKNNYAQVAEQSALPFQIDLQIGALNISKDDDYSAGQVITEAMKQLQYDVNER